MARFASRLAWSGLFVAAIGAGMSADVTPGATDWPSTNYDQSANRYSPLDSDHGAKCRHASAGLEHSSQARRLHRPAAGRRSDSHRDRQHDVSRRRRTAPSIALDATTGAEKWRFQLPNNDMPSKRGVAYWPGGGGSLPPSIIFGSTSGGLYSHQGVGRHAQ